MAADLIEAKCATEVPADIERIAATVGYYANGRFAFGILAHGTCFFPAVGASFGTEAKRLLGGLTGNSLDFTVREMDDRNFVVRFTEQVFAVVLRDEFKSLSERLDREVAESTSNEIILGRTMFPREHLLMGVLGRTRLRADLKDIKIVKAIQGK